MSIILAISLIKLSIYLEREREYKMKLSIVNVSKSYGSTKALSDFSLKIESGAVFGLIGSNGAGKSTLMKILATLITPTSGYCMYEDTDIKKNQIQYERT